MIDRFEKSTTKKLIDIVKPYKTKYLLGVIGYSSYGYLLSLTMALTLKGISDGIVKSNFILVKNSIYKAALLIVLLAIINAIFNYLYELSTSCITKDLYKSVFTHIHDVDFNDIESYHKGDLLYTITNDIETTSTIYSTKFGDVLSAVISGIGGGIFILSLNWQIGLFVILLGILTLYLNKKFCPYLRQVNENIQDINASMAETIMDIISNFKIIKIFNMENFILKKYEIKNQNLFNKYLKRLKIEYKFNSINYLIDFIKTTLIWIILSYFVFNKKVSIGSMIAILEMTYQVSFMFSCLSNFIVELQSSIACSHRVFKILEINKNDNHQNNSNLENFDDKYALEINNLNFINSEKKIILNDINLKIKKGSKLAILGSNGSGKSTLLDIILGFKNNYQGELRIFGVPYKTLQKNEIRNHISYMSQKNYLYDESIPFNILLDKNTVEIDEINRYMNLLNINNLINYTDNSSNLSGGEKQKIAFIRSLVKNSRILVLDEPTSNLDYSSTKIIENIMTDKTSTTTVICVSHNVQSVKKFDIICVLDNGKIVEQGNHYDLMSIKGIYYTLYKKSMNY